MSPVKDIDLIASEDVLYDEEEDDDDDADSLHLDTSRISSCSSKNSEGSSDACLWWYYLVVQQTPIELKLSCLISYHFHGHEKLSNITA